VRYMGRQMRIPKSGQSPAASPLWIRKKKRRPPTDWPAVLVQQCTFVRLPIPVREHRFHPTRRWRFDLAWLENRLAVEVDGGLFIAGRHARGAGMEAEIERGAEAMLLGWRVLRVSPRHVRDGLALRWIVAAIDPSVPVPPDLPGPPPAARGRSRGSDRADARNPPPAAAP